VEAPLLLDVHLGLPRVEHQIGTEVVDGGRSVLMFAAFARQEDKHRGELRL
jgi:hypothetical protein